MGAAGAQKRGLSHLAGFADSPPPNSFLDVNGFGFGGRGSREGRGGFTSPIKARLMGSDVGSEERVDVSISQISMGKRNAKKRGIYP